MKVNFIKVFFTLLSIFGTLATSLGNDKLLKAANKRSNKVINLTNKNYKRILNDSQDANLIVLFSTTSAQFGCNLCAELESEFDNIVASWFQDHPDATSKLDPSKALFFAKADVKNPQNIPEVFTYYKLAQIPRIYFFPAGQDMDTFTVLEMPQEPGMSRVHNLIEIIKHVVQIEDFTTHEPVNWSSFIITTITVFISVFILRKNTSVALRLLSSKIIWGVLSGCFIILMISGQMFNKIRNTMLAGTTQEGEIIYFMPNDFQNQFAIETQVIGVTYGVLAALLIVLVIGIPKLTDAYKKSNRRSVIEASFSILCAVLIYMFFSALTYVFGIKSSSYPYQLTKLARLFN
ncbi:hypothetical protein NCAS_0B06690 [Naumovozyma castellii]|uniref:Dolichyl-diphosphooligosaccharide--protein glycosyltransferase subunit 3 n=1 Tax=Naumovozyma castellii TaxID=27288 RepID=G0VA23_NAUCA|nr:hypothetical protein NCAS_0B06690 [Naumovozyma castellii CBS 4309]CCC68753.1 hypothetical protein NCAS_0B06690 [Naumovozyma castellii CBS 4309]